MSESRRMRPRSTTPRSQAPGMIAATATGWGGGSCCTLPPAALSPRRLAPILGDSGWDLGDTPNPRQGGAPAPPETREVTGGPYRPPGRGAPLDPQGRGRLLGDTPNLP